MADLHLGADARPVGTSFQLLGQNEDDLTRALAWALANCSAFLAAVLADLKLPFDTRETHRLRIQHPLRGMGRTDIELETSASLIIFEAKLGWNLQGEQQMKTYEDRIQAAITDHTALNLGHPIATGGLVTLSECSAAWAEQHLPTGRRSVPRRHLTWASVIAVAEETATRGPHHERRLLRELAAYLRSTTTMRDDPASQMTWIVPISDGRPDRSKLNFIETVQAGHYYNRPAKVPKGAFNFIGSRWSAQLREIRHVIARQMFTDPQAAMPDVFTASDSWAQHEHFRLGPPICPPNTNVRSG